MLSQSTLSPTDNDKTNPSILLLGMVFTEYLKLISWKNTRLGIKTLDKPNRGQEFRDMVRCKGLEKLGYDVKTLDNKHSTDRAEEDKHCQTTFCDPRRMKQSLFRSWGDKKFDTVILDYFFSPVGWARERWGLSFFKETLPMLATWFMEEKGCIYLPNLQCVQDCIEECKHELLKYFVIETISNPNENPLYKATSISQVVDELIQCPDMLTNETQIKPLNPDFPFFKLTKLPSDFVMTPSSFGDSNRSKRSISINNTKIKKEAKTHEVHSDYINTGNRKYNNDEIINTTISNEIHDEDETKINLHMTTFSQSSTDTNTSSSSSSSSTSISKKNRSFMSSHGRTNKRVKFN